MRRFFISVLTLAALICISPGASADEGMWLLPLLEKMNINTMQQMGCRLSAEDIYSINHSSIKDAVVHIPGCTAELISDEGLLVTNHHCGYSHIQRLSSVGHDYLTDGYWAMNRSQELPAEGFTASFLESFTDVTRIVGKALNGVSDKRLRDSLYKAVKASLVSKAVGNDKFLSAYVSELYGGNAYYLVVERVYKDVRFVGAPPSSIGKFGADTDNWMWPRHTCDFSMFRIYADKDNNPADYSPDNVPLRPKRHLTISLKGVNEGDFTMIIGFPGTTNRFMTASEVCEQRDAKNAVSIGARSIRLKALLEDMSADPEVRIKYSSKYARLSNSMKKAVGMNQTFGKLNVERRRADKEREFSQWVAKKDRRVETYGRALELIDDAVDDRSKALKLLNITQEVRPEIVTPPLYASMYLSGRITAEDLKKIFEQFYKDYSQATDRKVAGRMLEYYRDNVEQSQRCSIFDTIDVRFDSSIAAYVDDVFDNSVFASKEKAYSFLFPEELENPYGKKNADGTATDSKSDSVSVSVVPSDMNSELKAKLKTELKSDPAYVMSSSFSNAVAGLRGKVVQKLDRYERGKKLYIAGQLEMQGKRAAIYPDANSTMRLTYGQVKSYSPGDALEYAYYTTLDGVMEKEDPTSWEFIVPEKLKKLYQAHDYGRYAMADGRMPACFITTSDITGGNSGSPVLDAQGRLIGLAFDGNWEAMSGDIIFEPNLQRCINVDIRYVLFIVDKFGGAGYLLDEMTIEN